jgi:UDP-glucose 4-epimerase
MNNYLIIGHNGFIGKYLLKLNNNNVNCYFPASVIFGVETRLIKMAEILELYPSVLNQFSGVFILANSLKPSSTLNEYIIAVDEEALAILRISEKIASYGKKIIFLSSAGALYRNEFGTKENSPVFPINYYGLMKKNIEDSIIMLSEIKGLNYQIFRISNVYGPGQKVKKNQGIITAIYNAFTSGVSFNLYADPNSKKDYIEINDLVNLIELLISAPNGIYNVGSGESTSILEIIEIIEEVLGGVVKLNYETIKSTHSNIHNLSLDISKLINYCPNYVFKDIKTGIKNYINLS